MILQSTYVNVASPIGMWTCGMTVNITDTPIELARCSERDLAELVDRVYREKKLVLSGRGLTDEQFVECGKHLGLIVPYYESMYHHQDFPEIFVSSSGQPGQQVGVPRTGAFWHTDYQFMARPFAITMMYVKQVAAPDRATLFIDQAEALRRLPTDLRRRIQGLYGVNTPRNWVKIRPCDVYRPIREVLAEVDERTPPQTWPLIMTHPVTGEEFLYLSDGFTVDIIDADGIIQPSQLREEILYHIGQRDGEPARDLVQTQQCRADDILLWDNRIFVHKARPGSIVGPTLTYRLSIDDTYPLTRI